MASHNHGGSIIIIHRQLSLKQMPRPRNSSPQQTSDIFSCVQINAKFWKNADLKLLQRFTSHDITVQKAARSF